MSAAPAVLDDVKETYGAFHKRKSGVHTYPTEWVIRAMLGSYPRLAWSKPEQRGARVLDLGFGDCRNMPLLRNCGFHVYGVEISAEIVALAAAKLREMGIEAELRVGSNARIPFDDGFFDYLLACASCYYVDRGTTFSDNLAEMARVVRPGGALLANLPAPGNFILENARPLGEGHVEIAGDVFGLRNGYTFRAFEDEADVVRTFSPFFENVSVARGEDDFWGLRIHHFVVCANRARPL